jgi:hypothetical protein
MKFLIDNALSPAGSARTRSAQFSTDSTQADAVSLHDLLDRHIRFDLLEADPRPAVRELLIHGSPRCKQVPSQSS